MKFILNETSVKILLELSRRNMRPCELIELIGTTTPRMHRTLDILIQMGLVSRKKLFHQHAKHAVLYSLKDAKAREFVGALAKLFLGK